jgi:preprotein translocase subunit SecE
VLKSSFGGLVLSAIIQHRYSLTISGGIRTVVTRKEAVKSENTEVKAISADQGQENFVTATKEELAKVVWPSRQQLISESVAVILMVVLVSTVIYFVDQLFGWITKQPFLFG